MRWGYGLAVATILAGLSLYPQLTLIGMRGHEYNGAASVSDNDESAYITYVQALIDGRPRKNNIYVGGSTESAETFFSIQALPAYVVAFPARWLGLDAQTLFPFLSPVFAFAAALSLFWFFRQVTDNDAFAATAAFAVLVLGASAAGYGSVKYFAGLGSASASLPFLRRYTPGLVFPFFFILMGCIWQALKNEGRPASWLNPILAAFSFACLLYSYFFLWTAALAWISLVLVVGLVLSYDFRTGLWRFWLPFGIGCLLALVPYIWLLGRRSGATDGHQLLESTRELVLSRPPIWIGAAVLISLLGVIASKRIDIDRREILLIGSCALFPLVVFNQHILTGLSLQPFHYNLYIAPYLALISFVVLGWACIRKVLERSPRWIVLLTVLGVSLFGIVESRLVTQYRLAANLARDAELPVNKRLRQLAQGEIRLAAEQVTFNSDLFQADNQPAVAPQGVLWSQHLPWVSPITIEDSRRRYFIYLYYMERDVNWLRDALGSCPGSEACRALFGARAMRTLSIGTYAASNEEIEAMVSEFHRVRERIEAAGPPEPIPSYAVVRNDFEPFEFTNIDKWFARDRGEEIGRFTIYRLLPRQSQN